MAIRQSAASSNLEVDSIASFMALSPAAIPGVKVRLKKEALTGDGRQDTYWTSDGTSMLPYNARQLMFRRMIGLIASQTMRLTAAGRYPLTNDPVIPGGLITQDGAGFELVYGLHRAAIAGAVITRTYFGTNATHTANAQISTKTLATTSVDMQFPFRVYVRRVGATAALTNDTGQENGNGAASIFKDVSTNMNWAADQKASIAIFSNSAADPVDLLYYEVWAT